MNPIFLWIVGSIRALRCLLLRFPEPGCGTMSGTMASTLTIYRPGPGGLGDGEGPGGGDALLAAVSMGGMTGVVGPGFGGWP